MWLDHLKKPLQYKIVAFLLKNSKRNSWSLWYSRSNKNFLWDGEVFYLTVYVLPNRQLFNHDKIVSWTPNHSIFKSKCHQILWEHQYRHSQFDIPLPISSTATDPKPINFLCCSSFNTMLCFWQKALKDRTNFFMKNLFQYFDIILTSQIL